MELFLKERKDCYNFDESIDGSVINWSNKNTTDPLIEIQPSAYPSDLIYFEWITTDIHKNSILNYQWCGPMMMIAEYFSKFLNLE